MVKPSRYMEENSLIEGTYKFNADGSHNKVNVQSPCGGLLRDFVEISSKIFTAILAATIL